MTPRRRRTQSERTASSFRQQMRQSMAELSSVIARGESPTGGGRFTARMMHVSEPSRHGAKSVRAIRLSLNVSQAVFAQLLGVSSALVRAWELGTRTPSPLARRLLDQVRQHPRSFAELVQASTTDPRPRAA